MRRYCQKAAVYGKESIPTNLSPRHVTVILNPSANKRKAAADFEKYCAPLLHLAGISVDIKKTESEGHAKTLIDSIIGTDALVVAGGDGTLLEVLTGLFRKTNENSENLLPLGVLSLGKNNSVAKVYFPWHNKVERVKALAEATMAVIEETIKPMGIMKIEILDENNTKPVYAVGQLKWGAYRDAEAKKDSYSYFGPMKNYATYIFNGLKRNISWDCKATIDYGAPCEGCAHCYKKKTANQSGGWFSRFRKQDNTEKIKYSRIHNPECDILHEKKITTADLTLFTTNTLPTIKEEKAISKIIVEIGPEHVDYFDLIKNGIRKEKREKMELQEIIEAKMLAINPESNKNAMFSIDNESYEVKPIKVTLLPKTLKMF
ncbi:unnamed protein product [Callosobruchus maculatus]|uniref:Acylglycerol kinase, mitochondrial n=1 Tax=Callosobruchus maculatus TaxID=64391 RepID=A0A653CUH4_CALMS|nr:unnamed protein product [Callosobruchus maculatus]